MKTTLIQQKILIFYYSAHSLGNLGVRGKIAILTNFLNSKDHDQAAQLCSLIQIIAVHKDCLKRALMVMKLSYFYRLIKNSNSWHYFGI